MADEGLLNCMGVWGGNGSTENHFRRPGLDLWLWSQSQRCAEAGGSDLHLVSSCASGRITRLLLADVCGLGQRFVEIARELRELMKRNINTVRQVRFVREMSCRLEDASTRGGFASTLVGTYFAPARSFAVCNAGHPPPLLYRFQERQWSVLSQVPSGPSPAEAPLGVVDLSEYQQFRVKLEAGDMLLGYSNTLTECRTARGKPLGVEGFLSRVRQLDLEQSSNLVSALATQIRYEHKENLSSEDATLLLCRATKTRVAWRDNLLAPFRLLRAVSDRTSFA
jgi:hypothetical protein